MPPRRFTLPEILISILAGISGLLAVVVLALWAHSFHGADTAHLPGPGGGAIDVISDEGRLMIGVFGEDQRSRWGRRVGARLSDLQMDPGRVFLFDFWGWGVAIPHLVWAGALLIPPIWWALVVRDRKEHQHRLTHGLCRSCGYDLRFSENRCPECGTETSVAARVLDESTDASAAPLPPPPLGT